MDLLPRSVEEFREAQYWDAFFKKRGKDGTFEWYGEYNDLCGVLHKYCKAQHKTLVVGCGNSRLSEDLYDVGYRSLMNIDISDVAVRQMAERNAQRRPEMEFMKMDMREMTFADGHFDCVLDKATLDAIMAEDNEAISHDVTQIFDETTRVLKAGGRYICVTLAQGHILEKLLSYFPENWFVRVHKVEKQAPTKRESASAKFALPVFVFICTKKVSSAMPQVLEACLDGEENKPVRMESVAKLRESVKETQNFALLWQRLRTIHPGEEAQFDLWAAADASLPGTSRKEPRFTLHVVDNAKVRTSSGQFAVFIVPQGRETEWLFSSAAGRQVLAENAGYRRLAVVLLHRGHQYGSLQGIREELSGRIGDLVPEGGRGRFPVLSAGDDAGEREIVCTGSSEFSGDYVVEDFLTGNQRYHRRLVFLSSRNVVQSEARLFRGCPPAAAAYTDRPLPPVPANGTEEKPPLSKNQRKKARKAKSKANKASMAAVDESSAAATAATDNAEEQTSASAMPAASKSDDTTTAAVPAAEASASATVTSAVATTAGTDEPVDVSFLACEHHQAMICGLAVVRGLSQAPAGSHKALLVGLGGGGLARFVHSFIPPVAMDVVELDAKILEISKEWFGLREDSRLSVHIDDGLKYITDLASQDPRPQYSAIMFDVDGKDSSVGMSCPPVPFIEQEFLTKVKQLLAPHGVFILNLVCRDEELQTTILSRVSTVFATAYRLDISNEVNKILVALVQPLPCMHTEPGLDIPIMEWVKRSGADLEQIIVKAAPPSTHDNVKFITKTFAQLDLLR